MGATSPPTSPLHRVPPAYHHAGLKRKHDNIEEEDLMPTDHILDTQPEDSKKIRVEVLCGSNTKPTLTTAPHDSDTSSSSDIPYENRLSFPNNNATKDDVKKRRG